MRCSGKYKVKKQEIDCEKKWSCRNYSFRAKPKRVTPKDNINCYDQCP